MVHCMLCHFSCQFITFPEVYQKIRQAKNLIDKTIAPMVSDTIQPMLSAAKDCTASSAGKIAPMPSVKVYHEKQEVHRRNAVKNSEHPHQEMVKNYLDNQHAGKRKSCATVSPESKYSSTTRKPRTKKHKQKPSSLTAEDLLPLPKI